MLIQLTEKTVTHEIKHVLERILSLKKNDFPLPEVITCQGSHFLLGFVTCLPLYTVVGFFFFLASKTGWLRVRE